MRRRTVPWTIACVLGALITAHASSAGITGEAAPQQAVGSCAAYSGMPAGEGDKAGMVFIKGGSFIMGSDRERPEERFSHPVKVEGFWIDRHEVTYAEFAKFVEAIGYKTLGTDAYSRAYIVFLALLRYGCVASARRSI